MEPIVKTLRKKQRLTGEKVYLRAPECQDAEELIALNKASKRFHRGLVTPPVDAEQYQGYLKRSQREDTDCFLICQVSDHKIVGAINLSQIFRGNFQNAYLGYYLGSTFAGRGLMTEAIGLVLRHAFLGLGLHRVEANVQPHNGTSIAVLKRVGFSKEGFSPRYLKVSGRWRDHERWAIIVEDWREKVRLR